MTSTDPFSTRYERHFDDRMVRCYEHRVDTVTTSFSEAVVRAADSDCLVCEGERLTYAEVDTRARSLAGNLSRRGVVAGDRVAILLGNSTEFVLALLGILRLGAIAVPLNAREQGTGITHMLDHCQARALIFADSQADKLPGPDTLPALEHRFVVGGDVAGAEPFSALLDESVDGPSGTIADEEDPAVLLYTSGTTGQPKGVVLTHFNLIHSMMHYQHCMALGDGERSLLVVPASHVTGLVANVLTMLHVAGCVVIMREFDAPACVQLIAEERVSHVVMVPAMYNLCLLRSDLSQHDLSAWRIGGFGGAPMPDITIKKLRQQLPDLELIHAYGATETTSPATILPLGDEGRHHDSIGMVVPCGDIRVMDEHGCEVGAGQPGELWISGPMVVPGYWHNPEADQREFVAGHWCSGDIGSIDSQGYVRIFDRKKDMIIRGGYNIYSVELENLIISCPGVVECAVVARPDPVLGEKIHAFVSLSDNHEPMTVDELKAFCAKQLADYKIPDFITLQDDPLPRNANGKLMKATLSARSRTQPL